MKRQLIFLPLFLIFSIALFSACSTESSSTKGTLNVGLTDAPAAFDEVNIEILQVLVNKDGDAETDGDAEEEENGWYSIMDDPITVNLLDYQNGEVLQLGQEELEAGQYNQVRLLLGDGNSIVMGGETFSLTTPSGQQSGYKLNVNAEIEAGQVYDLVIDFDASQSVVVTGNNRFLLKPVLRTVQIQEQASISGTVLPIEAEPYVYAIMNEDTVGTQPDDAGNFRLIGLNQGTYDVMFSPTDSTYADSTFTGIELDQGEQFQFENTIQLEDTTSSSQ